MLVLHVTPVSHAVSILLEVKNSRCLSCIYVSTFELLLYVSGSKVYACIT